MQFSFSLCEDELHTRDEVSSLYSEMVVLRGLTLLIFIDFCRILYNNVNIFHAFNNRLSVQKIRVSYFVHGNG